MTKAEEYYRARAKADILEESMCDDIINIMGLEEETSPVTGNFPYDDITFNWHDDLVVISGIDNKIIKTITKEQCQQIFDLGFIKIRFEFIYGQSYPVYPVFASFSPEEGIKFWRQESLHSSPVKRRWVEIKEKVVDTLPNE